MPAAPPRAAPASQSRLDAVGRLLGEQVVIERVLGCHFDPQQVAGDKACPFTTRYRNFLARNRKMFQDSRRMRPQLANLDRKDAAERRASGRPAERLKAARTAGTYL